MKLKDIGKQTRPSKPAQRDFSKAVDVLQGLSEAALHGSDALQFLAHAANELDVCGKGGPYCYECAKERVLAGIMAIFQYSGLSIKTASEVIDDVTEHRCQACAGKTFEELFEDSASRKEEQP